MGYGDKGARFLGGRVTPLSQGLISQDVHSGLAPNSPCSARIGRAPNSYRQFLPFQVICGLSGIVKMHAFKDRLRGPLPREGSPGGRKREGIFY